MTSLMKTPLGPFLHNNNQLGSVSALEKKLCRAIGRSTFSFYFIEIFYTEIIILTKISPNSK